MITREIKSHHLMCEFVFLKPVAAALILKSQAGRRSMHYS